MGVQFIYRIRPENLPRVGWSYSGFNSARRELAGIIGINLDRMEGFCPSGGIAWSTVVQDPIIELLNHSDCDGSLAPSACKKIAARLRQLAPQLQDEYDRETCLALAGLMDECVRHHVPLEFR